jgi:hypothetical protein
MNQSIATIPTDSTALVRRDDELTVKDLVAQVAKIQEVMQAVMRRDEHYGVIPGTPKPSLLKAGAEKLCLLFRLDPEYESTETYDGPHLTVVSTCTLYHVPTGQRRGSGMGSCSTKESKYAYRNVWENINGKQTKKRVPNDDLADQYNVILKMACKRSLVAAVLNVTAASDIFTQDLEELRGQSDAGHAPQPAKAKPKPAAAPKQAPAADGVIRVHFGKKEGTPITELDDRSLDWFITAARDNIADPKRDKYREKNQEWLEHLLDERDRRADDTSEDGEAEAEVIRSGEDDGF